MSASSFEDWELQAPSRTVAVFTVYFSGKSATIYCTSKTLAVSVNTHCASNSISGWIFCLLLCFWPSCSPTSLKRWVTSRRSSLRLLCFLGGDHGSGGAEVSGSEQDCLLHHGGGGRREAPDWSSRGIQANVSVHKWMFVYHRYLSGFKQQLGMHWHNTGIGYWSRYYSYILYQYQLWLTNTMTRYFKCRNSAINSKKMLIFHLKCSSVVIVIHILFLYLIHHQ